MDTMTAIAALGALAQETRLAAYRLLVAAGVDGMAAGAIAEATATPASTLTSHLNLLVHAGLVTRRRRGRSVIYSADFDRMNALLGYLSENCCGAGVRIVGCGPAATATPEGPAREVS